MKDSLKNVLFKYLKIVGLFLLKIFILIQVTFGILLNDKLLEEDYIQDSDVKTEVSQEEKNTDNLIKAIIRTQIDFKDLFSKLALDMIWRGEGVKNYPVEKGMTYTLTGVCSVDADQKPVKLFEEQVTVEAYTRKMIKGVLRSENRVLNCNKEDVIIRPVKKSKIIDLNKAKSHVLYQVKNEIITATGNCQVGTGQKVLIEDIVDVFDVTESNGKVSVKGLLRKTGEEANCEEGSFRYARIDTQSARNLTENKKEVVDSMITVTGVCYEETKDDKGNTRTQNYNLLEEPLKLLKKDLATGIITAMVTRGKLKTKIVTCENPL